MAQISLFLMLTAVLTLDFINGANIQINQVLKTGGGKSGGETSDGGVHPDKRWADHMKEHDVQCDDEAHCALRRAHYEKKHDIIEKHNAEHADGKHSYEMGHNRFSHLSPEEVKRHHGYPSTGTAGSGIVQPTYVELKKMADADIKPKSALPKSVDWRKMKVGDLDEKNYLNEVRDQGGKCQSCWSFSAVAALESHWLIKNPKEKNSTE